MAEQYLFHLFPYEEACSYALNDRGESRDTEQGEPLRGIRVALHKHIPVFWVSWGGGSARAVWIIVPDSCRAEKVS